MNMSETTSFIVSLNLIGLSEGDQIFVGFPYFYEALICTKLKKKTYFKSHRILWGFWFVRICQLKLSEGDQIFVGFAYLYGVCMNMSEKTSYIVSLNSVGISVLGDWPVEAV